MRLLGMTLLKQLFELFIFPYKPHGRYHPLAPALYQMQVQVVLQIPPLAILVPPAIYPTTALERSLRQRSCTRVTLVSPRRINAYGFDFTHLDRAEAESPLDRKPSPSKISSRRCHVLATLSFSRIKLRGPGCRTTNPPLPGHSTCLIGRKYRVEWVLLHSFLVLILSETN